MNDVGGGAGYDQYDGYGGVASPMQRDQRIESCPRSRCGRTTR
jgi:hypothetical protein